MGFFLPMPPAAGGATEKTWHRLAGEFARRGHEVTIVSRTWSSWPQSETVDGVHYLRIPGYDHRPRLSQNILLDSLWSLRVGRHLPAADIVVVHAVTLPVWLGRLWGRAGRVVVMPGRMPRGQYRYYGRIARVLATSRPVAERVREENPALANITHVFGYPIAWEQLASHRPATASAAVQIGYVGRLHPEKGIDLLADAVVQLHREAGLPPWQLNLCGPIDIAAGGGGDAFRQQLLTRLKDLPAAQWTLQPPIYEEAKLAQLYQSLDIFCYPSRAAGETFGVAVAEAMAAGGAPVVSDLACFRDFVRPNHNGLTFDHTAADASQRLSAALATLIRDPKRRHEYAAAAQTDVREYDYPRYADALIADFEALLEQPN